MIFKRRLSNRRLPVGRVPLITSAPQSLQYRAIFDYRNRCGVPLIASALYPLPWGQKRLKGAFGSQPSPRLNCHCNLDLVKEVVSGDIELQKLLANALRLPRGTNRFTIDESGGLIYDDKKDDVSTLAEAQLPLQLYLRLNRLFG